MHNFGHFIFKLLTLILACLLIISLFSFFLISLLVYIFMSFILLYSYYLALLIFVFHTYLTMFISSFIPSLNYLIFFIVLDCISNVLFLVVFCMNVTASATKVSCLHPLTPTNATTDKFSKICVVCQLYPRKLFPSTVVWYN